VQLCCCAGCPDARMAGSLLALSSLAAYRPAACGLHLRVGGLGAWGLAAWAPWPALATFPSPVAGTVEQAAQLLFSPLGRRN
jgi:hypothetical protein